MTDSYQAIYDAARQSFDISYAVEVIKSYALSAIEDLSIAAKEQARPFVVLKPRMMIDGNQWCALYGEDLQSGVAGFGDTPQKASVDFDTQWLNAQAPKVKPR